MNAIRLKIEEALLRFAMRMLLKLLDYILHRIHILHLNKIKKG